ncbi:DUF1729-domain-containing protein [Wolfiporia cocos MD-104 SS10]|uniref:DUF1729-domain-containing protein n=1 Tax=Wolfiporia cocos (strain MD-104) TaxID=742152 RepID=A0A2H3IY35_WOLCO|nr:DUF1729-domain-containing protein [Wolfiporia cocos MD-104 SS10]
MPFDGLLFASRVMVAKEAHTGSASTWEGTYAKETDGILTVKSELSEPIHKVATRAVKLWKEFDDGVFKLPKDKRAAWLGERRAEVIAKLNRDFAKPWFGWKKDGTVVGDIADMTYEEVVLRMVRLIYVAREERLVDLSLRNLTGDWLRRVEERFAGVNGGGPKASILQSYSSLDKPQEFIESFFKTYPLATEQLLASEDKAYFLAISQRPGQKPVSFIPILDANFEVWFKKDSLWAAEDIEAVFDQDPQRVCILQGPVTVKHCTVKDEPIKDMLDNITSLLVQKLVDRLYNGDLSNIPVGSRPTTACDSRRPRREGAESIVQYGGAPTRWVYRFRVALSYLYTYISSAAGLQSPHRFPRRLPGSALRTSTIPTIDYLSAQPHPLGEQFVASLGIQQTISEGEVSYTVGSTVPETSIWLETLAGPRQDWLRALLTSTTIVQEGPRHAERRGPTSLSVYGAARSYGVHKPSFKAVEVQYEQDSQIIKSLCSKIAGVLQYLSISNSNSRNKRIKEFDWRLWFGDNEVLPDIDVRETFMGPEVIINANDMEIFCAVAGNDGEAFKSVRTDRAQAPMDFAIVTGQS